MANGVVELAEVDRFLRDRYGDVHDLTPLAGGVWSTAFAFRVGERALVIRVGEHIGDYEKDRMAAAWSRRLPIPAVLDVGPAFGKAFAISERVEGAALDAVAADRMPMAIESLLDALEALEGVTLPGRGYGVWRAPSGDAAHETWSDFLTSLPQRDDRRIAGWRRRLAAAADAQAVFDHAQRLLVELVHHCPSRRDVVHGDLLAGNVLVSPSNRIGAVLDWGNSLAGDPLYDLAWLMFWAPWHPGIDPVRVRHAAASRFGEAGLDERLLCYQLHIALDGMQYQAFAGRFDDLEATARRASSLLR